MNSMIWLVVIMIVFLPLYYMGLYFLFNFIKVSINNKKINEIDTEVLRRVEEIKIDMYECINDKTGVFETYVVDVVKKAFADSEEKDKLVKENIEKQNNLIKDSIDTIKENIGKKILDYEVIGCDDNLETIFLSCKNAIITVGQIKTNDLRVKLFDKSKNIGFNLPVIISSLAYVSKHSFIEEGTVIMHHALVNANVKIGKNCIINSKALIEHDCIIGNNCHISTASVINGGVVVKDNTFFGSNATSKQVIEIAGFIKAGSLAK